MQQRLVHPEENVPLGDCFETGVITCHNPFTFMGESMNRGLTHGLSTSCEERWSKEPPSRYGGFLNWGYPHIKSTTLTLPVEPKTYEIVGSEKKTGVLRKNPGFWKTMIFNILEFACCGVILPILWPFCLKSCLNVLYPAIKSPPA